MTNFDAASDIYTDLEVETEERPRRVLIVEDDLHLLSTVKDILEMENYIVRTATNGIEALKILQSSLDTPPDVIISDIMMPKMNGFEFLRHVRKEDRWVQVPFIFLTARTEREDLYKGQMLGADIYLTKPFEATSLLISVEAALRRYEDIRRVKNDELMEQKRKILTILNHEFRTPLTLVVAYAEMIKEFEPGRSDQNELMTFLQGLGSGADRMRRLVENFIVLVELDNGEAEATIAWRKRPVDDLRYMVGDATRQIASQRPRKFVTKIADSLPIATFDVQYMTIAVRELLSNASKFSEDDDTVLLKIFQEDEQLVFQVTDTGRGIPEEEMDNIWKPFYQINREHFEDQGAGSGLAIVQGIVKLHGGTCEIRSTLGEGSIFTIRIPLQP